jgi:hypothetical protein
MNQRADRETSVALSQWLCAYCQSGSDRFKGKPFRTTTKPLETAIKGVETTGKPFEMTGKGFGKGWSPSATRKTANLIAWRLRATRRRQGRLGRALRCSPWRSHAQITSRLIIRRFRRFPCVFAAPKRIGLKSHIQLSGVLVKSPRLRHPTSQRTFGPVLKSRLRGLTFAEAPLSAISRFNWSPESTEVRRLFKAPREDDSSFRADLEQSTLNERPFMKFVSLRTERTHQHGMFDKPSRVTLESFTNPIATSPQIHTYTELRQQIHDDLRIHHPEWVQPNGESPMCDSYESRLTELLDTSTRRGSTEYSA